MNYIVGVGNYSMYDDSIGIRVIEYIVENGLDENDSFKALDLSGNVLNLTAYFNDDTNKVIIIDSAKMNLNPGDYKFFRPENVSSEKELSGFSNHEGDVIKVIELAKRTGINIPEIIYLGIEPVSLRSEFGLSPELQNKIELYAKAAIEKIDEE